MSNRLTLSHMGSIETMKMQDLNLEKSMSERRAREGAQQRDLEGAPEVERKSGGIAESKTIEHSKKKKVSVEFIKAPIL